jgi:hypothetical protein
MATRTVGEDLSGVAPDSNVLFKSGLTNDGSTGVETTTTESDDTGLKPVVARHGIGCNELIIWQMEGESDTGGLVTAGLSDAELTDDGLTVNGLTATRSAGCSPSDAGNCGADSADGRQNDFLSLFRHGECDGEIGNGIGDTDTGDKLR